ncbi:MAG: Asp-tRNA(Asn)/Glu-tRNA(Gln) amidotransferase subunit GatC [Planctomycetaceae bacterium]|nr:Asp-tRNA(Asn)/Glu-tRNA(Gln) amidotransferase subunit GatC [Planctomycetaceae bacterium]
MAEPLSLDKVQRVANLARLKLSTDELQAMTTQLGRILDYVDRLSELDTEDVAPMAHAVEVSNVFREDVVVDSLPRPEALKNAPKTDGRFFLVPQVIEH